MLTNCQPIAHLKVRIQTQGQALIVTTDNRTVLTKVVSRECVMTTISTTINRKVIVVHKGILHKHLVLPIRYLISVVKISRIIG